MSGKDFAIGITIGAVLAKNFSRTTQGVKRELDAVGKAIDLMEQKRRAIKKFEIDSKSVHKLSDELSEAQKRLKSVQQQLRANPGDSGIKKEVSAAGEAVGRLSDALQRQRRQLGESRRALANVGVATRDLRQQYDSLGASIDRVREKEERANAVMERRRALRDERHELMGRAAGTVAATVGMAALPLHTYSDYDKASADLRVAMMHKGGQVSEWLEPIRQKAEELSGQLPGTLSQYLEAGRVLAEQGMKGEAIAHGALDATAKLGLVLNMNLESAAETVSKVRESFQLRDDEFHKAADDMQRASFAFGVRPDDLRSSLTYASANLNAFKLTGEKNLRDFLTIQGMGAMQGMEGSMFGTGFADALERLAESDFRLGKKSKSMRHVHQILDKHHIQLDFFDKSGQLKTIPNLVKEIGKLGVLDQKEWAVVKSQLFGIQAGRPIDVIRQKGEKGFAEARERFENRAELDEATKEKADTFDARKLEMLHAIDKFMVEVGKPIGNALKPIMGGIDEFVSKRLTPFAKEHPNVTAGVVGTVGGVAALSLGSIAARLGLNLFRSGLGLGGGRGGGRFGRWLGGKAKGGLDAVSGAGVQRVFVVNMPGGGATGGPAGAGVPEGKTGAGAGQSVRGGILRRGLGMASKLMRPAMLVTGAMEAGSVLLNDRLSGSQKGVALTSLAGGTLGGMAAGAISGAIVGSVVPVIGTAIGSIVGGALGYMGGEKLGQKLGEYLFANRSKDGAGDKNKPAEPSKSLSSTNTYHVSLNGIGMNEVDQRVKEVVQAMQREEEMRQRAMLYDGVHGD